MIPAPVDAGLDSLQPPPGPCLAPALGCDAFQVLQRLASSGIPVGRGVPGLICVLGLNNKKPRGVAGLSATEEATGTAYCLTTDSTGQAWPPSRLFPLQ